jgi:hypothetical protein
MRKSDFISPASRLQDALKQLEQQWMVTRDEWSDPVSQRVEDEFLLPLHGQIQVMLDTVNKLSGVMAKAERECAHPREQGTYL